MVQTLQISIIEKLLQTEDKSEILLENRFDITRTLPENEIAL